MEKLWGSFVKSQNLDLKTITLFNVCSLLFSWLQDAVYTQTTCVPKSQSCCCILRHCLDEYGIFYCLSWCNATVRKRLFSPTVPGTTLLLSTVHPVSSIRIPLTETQSDLKVCAIKMLSFYNKVLWVIHEENYGTEMFYLHCMSNKILIQRMFAMKK